MKDSGEYQLPRNLVPINYKIHISPDLINFTFRGECRILLSVEEETKEITCHAKNIKFDAAFLDDNEISASAISTDDGKERVTFHLENVLQKGRCEVLIKYTGTLNDTLTGFYRTKYFKNGQERYAAVTQLAATDARQAFPCWDEPALKATFDVTLTVPANLTALANTPVLRESNQGDLKTVQFETSPVMSTYLVAFAVGEFDHVEGSTDEGVSVRVYTPLGASKLGHFALHCGIKALEFFSKFFNISYPLNKYDMIALPDFLFGAMENWGLVTFREVRVLIDENNCSSSNKETLAQIVSHETAHQWFGNLVTMDWWTHLWLNEGFANFMQYLCTDHMFPSFQVFQQFVPDALIKALDLDTLSSSHPVEVEVKDPADINQIFDIISYLKGASILRMLYNWIGEESFKKGLNVYLNKYSYKNAQTQDLWKELELSSGLPVSSVMSNWTLQLGFPVIQVSERQDGRKRIVTLKQSKHSFLDDDCKTIWKTPISISVKGRQQDVKIILEDESHEVTIEDIGSDAWIKLNPNFNGFYRVNYKDMNPLLQALQNGELRNPLDRLNIVDDLFSMVLAGKSRTSDWLRTVQSLKNEDSYVVWRNVSTSLITLINIMQDSPYISLINKFVINLYSVIRTKVGWDLQMGDDHLSSLLRDVVLSVLCKAGDETVLSEGKDRFKQHVAKTKLIDADLRVAVYLCAGKLGLQQDYEAMLQLYLDTESSEEKQRILRQGIGAFNNKDVLRQALEFSLGDNVRSQDSVFIIQSVARNPLGTELAWSFFKDNISSLISKYGGRHMMTVLVKSVVENFVRESDIARIQHFFKENEIAGIERSLSQGLERIKINSAWLDRDMDDVKVFLQNNVEQH